MKNLFKICLCIFILIIIGITIRWGIYLPVSSSSQEEVLFVIKKGEGMREIAYRLKDKGLIKSKILFELFVLTQGAQARLQAGKYSLSSSMNIPQILNKLMRGDVLKEKITIIEGWNLKDIGWYLEEKGISQAEEFFEIVGFPMINYSKVNDLPLSKDFSNEFEFLKEKPKNLNLEGYLFPDTYEIDSSLSIEEIVKKILKNFDKKITSELREEIKKQRKTLHQILTMASLLEKEVKSYKEKQIVAGILWKRLNNWWLLQVDATLTYLTGKSSLQLTKKDKKIDSLYNTYRYYGLPPGPICNPGLESIKAAIYYKDSPYWYYLTTLEGKVLFSKTLKEHNIKKWKFLKNNLKQYD